MQNISKIIKSKYFLWSLLALPAVSMFIGLTNSESYRYLIHPSGEFSARFMIITMIATPLRMLFPTSGAPLWLAKNRRYFGVAAGLYGALHTVFYLLKLNDLDRIIADLSDTGIWTGWLAMAIFVVLTATSNDASIRFIKRGWKKLQRFVYPAAVLTLAHWLFVAHDMVPALIHFVPLAALETYRVWKNLSKQQLKPRNV